MEEEAEQAGQAFAENGFARARELLQTVQKQRENGPPSPRNTVPCGRATPA